MANIISTFKELINKNKKAIASVSVSIVLFILMLINSGYALTYLNADSFSRTVVSLASFFVLGFIFVITVDISAIITKFKSKKPTWLFSAFAVFVFSALLTMFSSRELNELTTYMSFLIQIASAFIFAKLITFRRFVKIYQLGLLLICLFAVFFYVLKFYFGVPLISLGTFVSSADNSYYNYFFISFQNVNSSRMQGVLWEPGLLATFILLGLSFELIFYKKVRWLYIVVFSVSLVLTKSTFGYFLTFLILLIVTNRKVRNIKAKTIIYSVLITTAFSFLIFSEYILTFLASVLPDVFGKMVTGRGTIRFLDPDRFTSPLTNLQIWWKSPFFGNGMMNSAKMYTEMSPKMAQTSTLTFYLAEFGLLGFAFTFFFYFGLFKMHHIRIENKVILAVLFFIIFNKEPHNGIIFEWILMFMFLKEGLDKDYSELAFDHVSDNSIIASFTKNDDSSILKRNIYLSLLVKGFALILGFFSYPIYRAYFNNNSVLGVWLSVVSLMAMIISLDLGLGNGLKNHMVKALTQNDVEQQRHLISSTYISTSAISVLFLAVIAPIIFCSNLNDFFGVSPSDVNPMTLKTAAFFVCLSICLEFTLKNVNSLLQAKQKQALSSIFALFSTILLIIFALVFKSDNSNTLLLGISIAYIMTINVPLIFGTIIVFLTYFKGCHPSFKYVSREAIKNVTTLGLGFFFIQIMLILINSTNETFISNLFGSDMVVEYTNYYKPFSIFYQLFSLITLPYWAIISKEKEENKISEIKKHIKNLFIFMCVFVVFFLGLSIIFQPFINLWLGDEAMAVDFLIVTLFDVFFIVWMIISIFAVVLNGLSVVKQQILFFGIAASIKITLCLTTSFYREYVSWSIIIVFNIAASIPLLIGEALATINSLRKLEKREA